MCTRHRCNGEPIFSSFIVTHTGDDIGNRAGALCVEDTDRLEFAHVAEFLALARISAQLDKGVVEMFDPKYVELLAAARARVAGDYEGDYPGPKVRPADA